MPQTKTTKSNKTKQKHYSLHMASHPQSSKVSMLYSRLIKVSTVQVHIVESWRHQCSWLTGQNWMCKYDVHVGCETHSSANRHSCSTPAETQDRKCFSKHLILVVSKVDMIYQICWILSFCWKLLSAYFAEIMIIKYITKYSSNCAKCACIRNTNICFVQCIHAGEVNQHFNLRPTFEL